MRGPGSMGSPMAAAGGKGPGAGPKAVNTVANQFKTQLDGLMRTLNATNPNFIRCIKPNELKVPDSFDAQFVVRQLRYLGIKEVVNIRQLGFPVRRTHADFLSRYQMLLPKLPNGQSVPAMAPSKESALQLMTVIDTDKQANSYACGNTKMFMKNSVVACIEAQREKKLVLLLVKLQAMIRGWFHRKRYLRIKRVRDQLKVAMQNAEDNLAQLEEAVDLAAAMGLSHDKLIKDAKALLIKTKEMLQVKKSLLLAIEAKDVQSLKAALDRSRAITMAADHPVVQQASSLLSSLEAHAVALNTAVKSRDLAGVRAALETAKKLGLMQREAEKQAVVLLQRLEAEDATKAALSAAIASQDMSALTKAIADADGMGLDDPSVGQAKSLLAVIKEQQEVIAELRAAIEGRKSAPINAAKAHAARVRPLPLITQLVGEADAILSTLAAEAAEEEMANALTVAISSKDYQLLEAAVARAKAMPSFMSKPRGASTGWAEHTDPDTGKVYFYNATSGESAWSRPADMAQSGAEMVSTAETAMTKIKADEASKAGLAAALKARTLDALAQAVAAADASETTSCDEYTGAVSMLSALKAVQTAIEKANASKTIEQLDEAINAGVKKGLEQHPLMKEAVTLRDTLDSQNKALAALQGAIDTSDEGILSTALERGKGAGLTEAHPVFAKAKATFNRVMAERKQRERSAMDAENRAKADAEAAAAAAAAAALAEQQAEEYRVAQAAAQKQAEEQAAAHAAAVAAAAAAGVAPPPPPAAVDKPKPPPPPGPRPGGAPPPPPGPRPGGAPPPPPGPRPGGAPPPPPGPRPGATAATAAATAATPAAAGGASAPSKQQMRMSVSVAKSRMPASVYRQDLYELSFFPKLKSGDDYVSGKLFGRGTLRETMLTWNKDVIPNCLTQIISSLEKVGLNNFRDIQGFMGDRSYSFADTLALEILEHGRNYAGLRDEIYVQIMKQCSFNPKEESVVRGWQLLGLCSETFLPTEECLPYVFHFMDAHIQNEVGGTVPLRKEYATYCLDTLQKTVAAPNSAVTPSIDRVVAFKDRIMQGGGVTVHFCDGSSVQTDVDPSMPVGQVIADICIQIDLMDTAGFAIFEVASGTEAYISHTDCLLDYEAAKKRNGTAQFVFKKRIFQKSAMPLSTDAVAITLLYHQAVHALTSGDCVPTVDDTVELYAIAALLEDRSKINFIAENINEQSAFRSKRKLLPPLLQTLYKVTQADFQKRVQEKQATLDAAKITMSSYLEIALKVPYFGCSLFAVQQDENANFPFAMLVGVNLRGIHFLDAKTRAILGSFYFDMIAGWTDTPLLFVTRVFDQPKNRLETLCLQTKQVQQTCNFLLFLFLFLS
jgi:hypothetical protein